MTPVPDAHTSLTTPLVRRQTRANEVKRGVRLPCIVELDLKSTRSGPYFLHRSRPWPPFFIVGRAVNSRLSRDAPGEQPRGCSSTIQASVDGTCEVGFPVRAAPDRSRQTSEATREVVGRAPSWHPNDSRADDCLRRLGLSKLLRFPPSKYFPRVATPKISLA